MKTILQNNRAFALVTVIIFCGVLALLAASMLRYSASERRGNERNRLILRAKNQAENVAVYAADQLSTKLYRMGSAPKMKFTWSGSGSKRVYPPPDSALNNKFSSASDVEVRAGIESASDYALVNDTTDSNNGLQISKARVPIIAKAKATHAALGTVTSYVEQDMEMALTPLFQFGMFYNMDLELYPSVAMDLSGPVHSNKRIMAKPNATATIALTFLNRVSCAQGLYAEAVLKSYTRDGSGNVTAPVTSPTDSTTTGSVKFTPASGGAAVDLKNSSSKWRDHKYTKATETTTTINDFRGFAMSTYGSNLRTSAHGVTPLQLPGIGTYAETDDPSTLEDERNNGRQLIEPPNPQKYNGSTWSDTTDDPDASTSKISYKAGLYIVTNPDFHATPRKGTLPDGTVVWVTPNSYRAWLNAADSDGNRTCTEVVLPGQPSYGYNAGADGTLGTADDYQFRNYLPNRYTDQSAGGDGTGNQVLRVPQAGYGIGTGYLVNGTNAANSTSIAVKTGTAPIMAGEVIRIGTTARYVVAENFAGGSGNLMIMAPGLLASASDNTAIAIEPWGSSNIPSPGYRTYKSSGTYAIGTDKIDLRLASSGTGGAIFPGTAITIGSYKYLVTAAPVSTGITSGNYTTTSYTIGIAPIVGGTVASAVSVTIDATPFNLGTGLKYRTNGPVSAGGKSLTLGTGSGTVLVGDTIFVGGNRYLVVSSASTPPTSAPTIGIHPGAVAAIGSGSVAIVDPFKKSGYSRSSVYPVANTGINFPTDSTAPYGPADAYFFDMRRANANSGHTGYATTGDPKTQARYDRNTYTYKPRACAKVDFDMTRFRMFVDRVMSGANTSTIYDVRVPSGVSGGTGVWNNSIFNEDASRAAYGLGIGSGSTFTEMPLTTDADTKVRLDPYNLYYAPDAPEAADLVTVVDAPMDKLVPASALFNDAVPDAWYDGLAVYIHSLDAEKRQQTSGVPDRVDSGVRLWNGRGPVISLSTATKTGFTFVTNDAVYIVGHFNADGNIDAVTTDVGTGSPNYYGGYSGTYPDGAEEKLCAVMGDAFTALSQPTWTSSSGGQTGGWNDALSPLSHSSCSSGWASTSSTTGTLSGAYDGLYLTTNVRPGLLPNQSYSHGSAGTAGTSKLAAVVTEMSTALLMGLVPSNHNPTGLTDGYVLGTYLTTGLTPAKAGNGVNSGGANNFPRLLEAWSNTNALYIRGSIVGLYESRVAMEPFTNARCYNAPGRFWGLHYNFSKAKHDVPLEPIVIGSNRVGFRELSAAQYAEKKATIEALP